MPHTHPQVTVIVPVYNVRSYVGECLESIVRQTYDNIQIIVVDDGSTDDSLQVVHAFSDPRIEIVVKENGGLSSARNAGLDHARGDYLIFVDADDLVHHRLVETAVEAALATRSDLVKFKLAKFSDGSDVDVGGNIDASWNERCQDDAIADLYCPETLVDATVAVSKLYARTVYSQLRFPEGRLHEDVATCLDVVLAARRIAAVDAQLYFYRNNPTSITNTADWRHVDALIFYERHYRKLRDMGSRHAQDALLSAFKTGMGHAAQFRAQGGQKARRARLIAHIRKLAYMIDGDGLAVDDRLVVGAMRVWPRGAVTLYRAALALLG